MNEYIYIYMRLESVILRSSLAASSSRTWKRSFVCLGSTFSPITSPPVLVAPSTGRTKKSSLCKPTRDIGIDRRLS